MLNGLNQNKKVLFEAFTWNRVMIEYDFLHEVMPSSWLKGRRTGMKLRMWRCHSGRATDRWWPRNQDRDHDEVTSSRQLFVLKPTSPLPDMCFSSQGPRPRYLREAPPKQNLSWGPIAIWAMHNCTNELRFF